MSTTNQASSTSYIQVRKEFTSCLLSSRSVRTPLATLDKYVDISHRLDSVTVQRKGRIELLCNNRPLPDDGGVETLELIRENDRSSDFHVQLIPTPTCLSRIMPQHVIDLTHFDELSVSNELNKLSLDAEEFVSIHVFSKLPPREHVAEDESDDETEDAKSHTVLLYVEFGTSIITLRVYTRINFWNEFIFKTELSTEQGFLIQTSITGTGGVGR
ncbi:hypothetical protein DE146DRAFT_751213 [Phaeosphaeria sp. MPI-PUGE-AT-0046c]|nr:hypothetical protein DE146DRAFT_751213 [Phaeosphaeria sp. MPI-PUGE-AT-0046c]